MDAVHGIYEYLIQLEDVPGSLATCCGAVADAGVNITSVAGLGSEHALAAIVTHDDEATRAALDSIGANYTVSELQIAGVSNEPDSLASLLRSIAADGDNLRSVYVIETHGDGDITQRTTFASVTLGYTTTD